MSRAIVIRMSLVVAIRMFFQAHGGLQSPRKALVAHRGASAYAPEHTLAAYRLAIDQGADYVEQDLAVTRDGVLICLHDDSLERTTNVEAIFPDRAVVDPASGQRRWLAADFTLAEIKQLDAGTWFDQRFAGERVPTWYRLGLGSRPAGRLIVQSFDDRTLRDLPRRFRMFHERC